MIGAKRTWQVLILGLGLVIATSAVYAAVELLYFTGTWSSGQKPVLAWGTESEQDSSGFYVWRSTENLQLTGGNLNTAQAQKVSELITGYPCDPLNGQDYSFTDAAASSDEDVYYYFIESLNCGPGSVFYGDNGNEDGSGVRLNNPDYSSPPPAATVQPTATTQQVQPTATTPQQVQPTATTPQQVQPTATTPQQVQPTATTAPGQPTATPGPGQPTATVRPPTQQTGQSTATRPAPPGSTGSGNNTGSTTGTSNTGGNTGSTTGSSNTNGSGSSATTGSVATGPSNTTTSGTTGAGTSSGSATGSTTASGSTLGTTGTTGTSGTSSQFALPTLTPSGENGSMAADATSLTGEIAAGGDTATDRPDSENDGEVPIALGETGAASPDGNTTSSGPMSSRIVATPTLASLLSMNSAQQPQAPDLVAAEISSDGVDRIIQGFTALLMMGLVALAGFIGWTYLNE